MTRTKSFYDLHDALVLSGCPVCRLKAAYTERLLDNLLYEKVNDPGLRARIRQARGFCHEHAWGLVRESAVLGVSIILRDVLHEVLRIMSAARFRTSPTLSFRRVQEALDLEQPRAATAELVAQLGPQEPCPICVYAGEMEEACLSALRDNLLDEDGLLAAYRSSDGLCLPHFRQVLTGVDSETTFRALVDAQQAIWSRLEQQLGESIRKSDYRFSSEPVGDEAGAWRRAIAAISAENLRRGGTCRA